MEEPAAFPFSGGRFINRIQMVVKNMSGLLVMCCLLSAPLFGQEYSLAIPITQNQLSDAGFQIQKVDDGYIILGQSGCIDTNVFIKCLGLLKTDDYGNPLWSANYDGGPFGSLRPNGRTMFIRNDTIYVANMIWKTDHDEIRMMAFDMEGNLLKTSDFFIPYENTFFLRGMIGTEEKLVVFSEAKQGGLHRVVIQDFDFQFNLLGEYHLGVSPNKKRDVILKKAEEGDGFYLAYGEQNNTLQSVMRFNQLDEGYNIVQSKQMPALGDLFSSTDFIETEEGFMLAWNMDYSHVLFDTFPYPTIVFGLDPEFEVEWEYIFVHKSAKQHISTIKTKEGSMLGIGGTDFLRIQWIYPERSFDGWVFLLDPLGELIWERVVIDTIDRGFGRLWHGVGTENGFTLVGDIDLPNLSGDPFFNDPEVWFLTLDNDGCWNGNCEDVIVITGDSTSITDAREATREGTSRLFPNPTKGLLTIENGEGIFFKKQSVNVSDLNGKRIAVFELNAPRSTIDLSDLENGIYIVTQMTGGEPISSQKVVVQH